MGLSHFIISSLKNEANALMNRLDQVRPFATTLPMVSAAKVSTGAMTEIERYLFKGRRELRGLIKKYIGWLQGPSGQRTAPEEAQRRLSFLRLKFNAVLSQFDIFADVITQRSEHEYGIWLAGLDALAADALVLKGNFFRTPHVITYFDRGLGAAIRRARTRLPGGGKNPAAIIRIPRERMVGSGIASSLVHEAGHQGSALLDLVNSFQNLIQTVQRQHQGDQRMAWTFFERWISEIIADFWSVAKLGVTSTQGLMGVVSLPRAFVFRISMDDPHPFPWIRVKLSAAIGNELFPDPQWKKLGRLWEAYYPKKGLDAKSLKIIDCLEAEMPRFTRLLVRHRPKALQGKSLHDVFLIQDRQLGKLRNYYETWRLTPGQMYAAPACLVFAVIGQAKADGRIKAEEEGKTLSKLLDHWAIRSSLGNSFLNSQKTDVQSLSEYRSYKLSIS